MQNHCSNEKPEFAGLGVRLAAYLVDKAIILIPTAILGLSVSGVTSLFGDTFLAKGILFQYTLSDIAVYIAQALYFILFTYCTGATLGKRIFNLKVVSKNDGEKLDIFDVVFRETIGRFLCGFLMGIGYLMILIDKEKSGLHDYLSDTRVIYGKTVKIYPQYVRPVVSYGTPGNPVQQSVQEPFAEGPQMGQATGQKVPKPLRYQYGPTVTAPESVQMTVENKVDPIVVPSEEINNPPKEEQL